MPLFSYYCTECGAQSELLIRGGEHPACPSCGSVKLEKQASRFAAVANAAPEPMCASGACSSAASCPYGGGCCGMD